MRIEIEYVAQMRNAAGGTERETVDLPSDATLRDLLEDAAERHGERLTALLLDDAGKPRSSTLVFVGEEQVSWDNPPRLTDSANVTLLAPLAGG